MDNFCAYCNVVLPSELEFQAHCLSESHQLTIMSDVGRDWKFRSPARGVPAEQYTTCNMFSTTGKCRLGQQCCDAHGLEELTEWRERYAYRQLKLQHAKECSLQGSSYVEQLLEKWLSTTNPQNIMKENLDGVDVLIEPETNLTVSEKNCCREWTFRITTKAPLRHVALLHEAHRSHFRLSQLLFEQSPGNPKEIYLGPKSQEWSFSEESNCQASVFICKVRFVTSIYGTFRQAIVFDFGFEPVLIKKLSVDVVSITDLEKLQQIKDSVMSFTERWNSDEVDIVPFGNRPYAIGENEKELLAYYPPPDLAKFQPSRSIIEPVLTKDNYNSRLHELLCIEEMSQYELLSQYNVNAPLNLATCYLLTPNSATTAKYAHNGELFANMNLSSVLSEDSASGRLILTNCSTVLLASTNSKGDRPRKVYEALIEDKGKNVIYIRLSKQCSEELQLQADREITAEVQFQLNRLPLCEMHFSVDRLHPPSLVFPDITAMPAVSWNSDSGWLDSIEKRLNTKQKEAIMAITAPINLRLPPVLIIGPFGTGKTFTLACAVKILLADPNSKVLVCTHSNSAADIYIREYLHPLVAEGNADAAPLRIFYRHRWVATVHPTVIQYSLVSRTDSDRSFNMPTIEDIKRHRVVVTTLSTSKYLLQMGLDKGIFTHILIDEAAQAMECEAIMPLSLANENTRIVLAGDHMQLSPEVYSTFAQEHNLHTSLLERLYDLYPESFPCKILLCENYRSHAAIIQYTSELFYDNHLIASAVQPRHDKYYPLTFFTARGEDIQDVNSTAYHNNAEVFEIVDRVIELKKSWPEIWGDQDDTSIGVVTPYYDQVVRIRAELRKKKLHGVSVERVLNVQGKQFRVIILSTVRTRQTCFTPKFKESDLDHGFLSNARLLNTAITRAQSLVAVIGDPVSLCSVGKCRKLWEKFIHTCHEESSLFGITWDSLRSHLDSIELKKNFILNPLAPEFVPGRMFHGQADVAAASREVVLMPNGGTTPYPYWLFYPTTTQIPPPAIQPQLVTPPMVPTMPYYNCPPASSMAPRTMPMPFSVFSTPTTPPIRASPNLQRRPPRWLDAKNEYERNCTVGRPIKRANAFPWLNGNKAMTLPHRVDERPLNRGVDDRLLRFDESAGPSAGVIPEPMENSTYSLFPNDKVAKSKPEEHLSVIKQNIRPEANVNSFNGMPDAANLLQSRMKCNSMNGSPFRRPMLDCNGMPYYSEVDVGQNPHNADAMNKSLNNHQFFGAENRLSDKDRAIAAALDEFLVAPPANAVTDPDVTFPVQKWYVPDPPTPWESFQQLLREKLTVLERVLPSGTDLKNFLEIPAYQKAIFSQFLAMEGPQVAKRFLNLVLSIKQDQEFLLRSKYANNSFDRRELANNLNARDASMSSRFQNNAMIGSRPPMMLQQQNEASNSYDPFKYESSLGFNRAFIADKPDMHRSTINGESKNGYVHNALPSMFKSRDFPPEMFASSSAMEKSQEQLLYELRSLSMSSRNETCMKSSLSPDGPICHTENISEAVRRAELERQLRESQKDLWAPLPLNPRQFSNDTFVNKMRNVSGAASNTSVANAMPTASFEAGMNLRGRQAPGPMTALSMSYPDIPGILPAHIHNSISKEPVSKVIQKPDMTRITNEAPVTNPQCTSSQFGFDFTMQQQNNCSASAIPYSPVASEGMTYAKILRSPHP